MVDRRKKRLSDKVITGKFTKIYYNECEAGCPLGIEGDTICEHIKKLLNIEFEGPLDSVHNLLDVEVEIRIKLKKKKRHEKD